MVEWNIMQAWTAVCKDFIKAWKCIHFNAKWKIRIKVHYVTTCTLKPNKEMETEKVIRNKFTKIQLVILDGGGFFFSFCLLFFVSTARIAFVFCEKTTIPKW